MLFLACMSLFFSICMVVIYCVLDLLQLQYSAYQYIIFILNSIHAHLLFSFCYIACILGVLLNNVYLRNSIIKTSYVKVYLNMIEQRHINDVPDRFAHAWNLFYRERSTLRQNLNLPQIRLQTASAHASTISAFVCINIFYDRILLFCYFRKGDMWTDQGHALRILRIFPSTYGQ